MERNVDTVVFVFDQGAFSGGASKVLMGEAIELKKKGYRVVLFCGVGPVDDAYATNNIEVVCINDEHIGFTSNPISLLKGVWNRKARKHLENLLDSCNIDSTIVHIHGWTKCLSSSVFIAAKKRGFKVIVTLHDYFVVCPNGGLYNYKRSHICQLTPGTLKCRFSNCDKRAYYQKLYRNVRQKMQSRALRTSSPSVIYISEFSKEKMRDKPFTPGSEYILENFVDNVESTRIEVEKNDAFLFIGRLSREKGIQLFCEAICNTKSKGIVVGDGPLYKQYKLLYPEIEFVGWKHSNEMLDYIKRARALIVASVLYETMGLTVVEMMNYGIPCIVPRECAPAAYVVDDETGLLFSAGDVSSLQNSIDQMKNDEKAKLLSIRNYKSKQLDRFSLHSHIEKLEAIYEYEINNIAGRAF